MIMGTRFWSATATSAVVPLLLLLVVLIVEGIDITVVPGGGETIQVSRRS